MTALVCIDTATQVCTRYFGRVATHILEVRGPLTAQKVETIRLRPDEPEDYVNNEEALV